MPLQVWAAWRAAPRFKATRTRLQASVAGTRAVRNGRGLCGRKGWGYLDASIRPSLQEGSFSCRALGRPCSAGKRPWPQARPARLLARGSPGRLLTGLPEPIGHTSGGSASACGSGGRPRRHRGSNRPAVGPAGAWAEPRDHPSAAAAAMGCSRRELAGRLGLPISSGLSLRRDANAPPGCLKSGWALDWLHQIPRPRCAPAKRGTRPRRLGPRLKQTPETGPADPRVALAGAQPTPARLAAASAWLGP